MTAHEHEIIEAFVPALQRLKGTGWTQRRSYPKHPLGNLFTTKGKFGVWLRVWNEEGDARIDRYSFVFSGIRVVVDQRIGMVDGMMTFQSIRITRGCLSDLILASLI